MLLPVFFARFSEDSEEPYDALFTSHLFFLFLNHLFDHIAADGTSLCGGQVTIVALSLTERQSHWQPPS